MQTDNGNSLSLTAPQSTLLYFILLLPTCKPEGPWDRAIHPLIIIRADSSKVTFCHPPATSQEGTGDHLSLEASSGLCGRAHIS